MIRSELNAAVPPALDALGEFARNTIPEGLLHNVAGDVRSRLAILNLGRMSFWGADSRGWVYSLTAGLEHRSRGLRRELMKEAGFWLVSRGAPRLEFMVRDGNGCAEKFYDAFGFGCPDVKVYGKWLKFPEAAQSRKAS